MTIKINHIGVKNLGPLPIFDKDFKQINLIYAQNEHGKTYLVEFIYRSIFKNLSINTRINTATGQIIVSGLDKQSVAFSPSSKKKLEDFWAESIPGLPRDFSKLLVVKGAELDFTSLNPAGVDDTVLKEFLSGEGLLDKIGKRLGKTETSATISDGRITGAKRGELQKYYENRDRIEKIDSLFININNKISGGTRFRLNQEINHLSGEIQDQEYAKRYQAYSINQKINSLKAQRQEAPDNVLEELNQELEHYKQNKKELDKKEQEFITNKENSKNYPWLNSALEEYQKLFILESTKKPQAGKIWLITTLLAISLSIILILLKQPYIGIIAIVVALITGFIYLKELGGKSTGESSKYEIVKIEKEYKERFGNNLSSGTTTIKTKLYELQPVYFSLEQLKKDIEQLNLEQMQLEQEISMSFRRLGLPNPAINSADNILEQLHERNNNLDNQIRQNEIYLARLNIQPENYTEKHPSIVYDPEQLANLKTDLEEKMNDLLKSEGELQQLKQAVCAITQADINIDWEELIEKLQIKRQDTVTQYRDSASTIIAQIKLSEVLNDMRNIETERIDQGLNSNDVQQALKTTTGHYSNIEKEANEIFVSDQFGRYKLKDLSTGAREQVLFGLRIGFASRILAGQPLFLILDDAFQHSDWKRREGLVQELFALAENGWQIIYFTMDDHIRQLFETRSKLVTEDMYQTIILHNE
jgi:uncharacterized protein YhaN